MASRSSPSPPTEVAFRLSHRSSTLVALSTTESLYCLKCFAASALTFCLLLRSLTSPLFLSGLPVLEGFLESWLGFRYASFPDRSLRHSSLTLSLRTIVFGWSFCCWCWGCWLLPPCWPPSLYVKLRWDERPSQRPQLGFGSVWKRSTKLLLHCVSSYKSSRNMQCSYMSNTPTSFVGGF